MIVREYTLDDLDDVYDVFSDPLVSLGGEDRKTRDQTRAWLVEELEYLRRDRTGRYALELRETGRVVGGTGLVRRELDGVEELELGYHLRSDLWGRGLATEAARAMLQEARARGEARVIAFIEPDNERSKRVARRIGMSLVRRTEWFGRPHDLWVAQLAVADSAIGGEQP
jgi:ribosomal-protein-alanine N-acetyltransferase